MSDEDWAYRDLIRRFARPTDDQIAAFARHVSTDHSWYKHLPRTGRGEPFFFYLDPHVQEELVEDVNGSNAWRPIVREQGEFPFPTLAIGYEDGDVVPESALPMSYFTRHTTAEWREWYWIFSYWNHGPPDQPPADALESARRGLRYGDDSGIERPVPLGALECGLVYLRATVSPEQPPEESSAGGAREPNDDDQDRQRQFIEMTEAMARVVSWVYDVS